MAFGVGSGSFQAVDLALAIDSLPHRQNAGSALGLWGIAYFLGQSIGPAMCGLVLEAARVSDDENIPEHYKYWGYCVVMSLGCIAAVVAGGTVHGVRKTK